MRWPQGEAVTGSGVPDVELSLAQLPAGVTGRPVTDLLLSVSPTGAVEGCQVVSSSGSAKLDAVACSAGVQGADLQPPTGADGAAVAYLKALRVRFVVYPHYAAVRDPQPVADIYPEKAQRLGVTGFAILGCQAVHGLLQSCEIADETPKGAAFGLAALRLAKVVRLTLDEKGDVFVPFQFDLDQHKPAPPLWIAVHAMRFR